MGSSRKWKIFLKIACRLIILGSIANIQFHITDFRKAIIKCGIVLPGLHNLDEFVTLDLV